MIPYLTDIWAVYRLLGILVASEEITVNKITLFVDAPEVENESLDIRKRIQ